jgi:hypothetical protein
MSIDRQGCMSLCLAVADHDYDYDYPFPFITIDMMIPRSTKGKMVLLCDPSGSGASRG